MFEKCSQFNCGRSIKKSRKISLQIPYIWKKDVQFRMFAIFNVTTATKVLSRMDDILIYTWVICNKITGCTLQTGCLCKKIGME